MGRVTEIGSGSQTVGRSPPQFRHLFQPPELVGIADRVDPGDPAILDHQTHRGGSPPMRTRKPGIPLSQAVVNEMRDLAARARSAASFSNPVTGFRSSRHHPAAIGDQYHIRGEHLHQSLHVAGGHGSHELLYDCLMLGWVHLHPRPPRGYVLARTVRDLPDRGRGLAHYLRRSRGKGSRTPRAAQTQPARPARASPAR